MFPPFDLLSRGASAASAYLAAVDAAGIDHVCCADHVSFAAGGLRRSGPGHGPGDAAPDPAGSLRALPAAAAPPRPGGPAARRLRPLAPGRLVFGVGVGGEDRHEVAICGVDPATRGRRMDECLEVLRELMTGAPTTFHGPIFDIEAAVIAPAPERPIPIIVGGRSDAAMRAGRPVRRRLARHLELAPPLRRSGRASATVALQAGRPDPPTRHGMQVWCGLAGSAGGGASRLAPAMEAFYRLPFEQFERYCPYGTAEDVAAVARAVCRAPAAPSST